MDFPEFYKELEAEFWGASAKLMGLQLLQPELRFGKILLGFSGPSSQLKFYASFGLQVFAIGERHLSIESIIASRSTDVMVEPQ
ncbi:hypothetical protein Tco_0109082 [Tanacetum coccineum]